MGAIEVIMKKLKFFLKSNDIIIIISFFILSTLFTIPIILSGNSIMAYGEISHISTDNFMQLKSMGQYGQFPLWNNYLSMGMPLYPQPDGNFYYPFINPFYAVFGILNGMYAIVIFHIFLAGVGFWYYSKYLSKNALSRYFGSTLYMFAGAFIIRIPMGHIILYCPYAWIPISLYFIHTAVLTNKLKHFLLAVVSILMLLLIGVYIFFFFFMIFISYAFFSIMDIKKLWKPKISINKHNLVLLSLIFITVIGLACVKVIPMFYYNYLAERRVFGLYASLSSGNLLTYFISKQGAIPASGGFDVAEMPYGYIGIIPMFFMPFSIFNKNRQKNFLYLSSAILLLWGMGFYTVAGVVHLLPIASAIRAPERVLIPLSFTFIALAVLGFEYAYEKKYSKVLFLLLIFALGLEVITPFLFYVVFPANYEGYASYTANHLDLMILTLAVFAMFTIIFVLWFIYRPKLRIASLLDTNKVIVYLALFAIFNIFVTNINVMGGDDFKDQCDVSKEIIDIVKRDNPDGIAWINFSEPYTPFRFNQPYFVARGVHIAPGLRGTSDAWYENFKPDWNVDIGNTTYFTYDYEAATSLLNTSNHKLVGSFNVSLKKEEYSGDIEPSSLGEFGESQFIKNITYYNITIYVHRVVNSLPDVFTIINDTINPQNITYYSPNKIEIKIGGQKGDRIVIKTSYYPGWKYVKNGKYMNTEAYKRMISFIKEEDGVAKYTVVFDPGDIKIGAAISLTTIILICTYAVNKKYLIHKKFLKILKKS